MTASTPLDGHLDDDALAALDDTRDTGARAHLAACGECAARYDALARGLRALATTESAQDDMSASEHDAVLAAVLDGVEREERARAPVKQPLLARWLSPVLGLAGAAGAAALVVGLLVDKPADGAMESGAPVAIDYGFAARGAGDTPTLSLAVACVPMAGDGEAHALPLGGKCAKGKALAVALTPAPAAGVVGIALVDAKKNRHIATSGAASFVVLQRDDDGVPELTLPLLPDVAVGAARLVVTFCPECDARAAETGALGDALVWLEHAVVVSAP